MHLTDVREVFEVLAKRFNPDAAQGLDAVLQFDITGDGEGTWVLLIRDGVCQVREEIHENPSVRLENPSVRLENPSVRLSMKGVTWLSIVNKELSAVQAFLSGRLKIKGDMSLAQKIPELFSL